jgi:hypothetical protein
VGGGSRSVACGCTLSNAGDDDAGTRSNGYERGADAEGVEIAMCRDGPGLAVVVRDDASVACSAAVVLGAWIEIIRFTEDVDAKECNEAENVFCASVRVSGDGSAFNR